MSSNKRYEIQEGFAKKSSPVSTSQLASSLSDSIGSQYFKNEEQIMKDIKDIQKKQAAQVVEEE